MTGKMHQLVRGKHCFKCGNKEHNIGEACPADSVLCSACHTKNHFARVCVKSGRAEIVKSPNSKRKQLNKITVEGNSDNEAEYYDDLNAIASVTGKGRCAVLYAVLNGRKTRMLYDPGAAFSVINKQVWQCIGSPSLSPMLNLLAYTKV